jgi:hypothetical protein
MGITSRSGVQGVQEILEFARGESKERPLDPDEPKLAERKKRGKRQVYARPSLGDRNGKLKIVSGGENEKGVYRALVQCDCGSSPREMFAYQFRDHKGHGCKDCVRGSPPKKPRPEHGTRVGKLEVIGGTGGMEEGGAYRVLLQCDCGSEPYSVSISTFHGLKGHGCKACIEYTPQLWAAQNSKEPIDISVLVEKWAFPEVGAVLHELTVLSYPKRSKGGKQHVEVQCSCGGAPYYIPAGNLRSGAAKQCRDCGHASCSKKRKSKTGYALIVPDDYHCSRLVNRINASIRRCHNENDAQYPNYGGRGIQVYTPWRAHKAEYLRYLISLPNWEKPELELDRIDVDKGYEPDNLRFVTPKENCNNKRSIQGLQKQVDTLRTENAELLRINADLEQRLRRATGGTV